MKKTNLRIKQTNESPRRELNQNKGKKNLKKKMQ